MDQEDHVFRKINLYFQLSIFGGVWDQSSEQLKKHGIDDDLPSSILT